MPRYFIELSYNGTRFFGWQRQPQEARYPSVQGSLEAAFSTVLQKKIDIIGCGRTDTGVHAKQYFAHFDFEHAIPNNILSKLNKILGKDIFVQRIFEVSDEMHARFSAISRSYEYHIGFQKNPFRSETAFFYPYASLLEVPKMQAAAQLLMQYSDFSTFCKTGTSVKTNICCLTRSEWIFDEAQQNLTYHVSSDRFLRGMIRLIVGMCINVGTQKIQLSEVQNALDTQTSLKKPLSVPPQGLFLTDICY